MNPKSKIRLFPILFFIKQRKGRECSMYSAIQMQCTHILPGWAQASLCKYWQSLHLSKSSQSLILSAHFVYSSKKVMQLGEKQAQVWLVSPGISPYTTKHLPMTWLHCCIVRAEPPPQEFSSCVDVLIFQWIRLFKVTLKSALGFYFLFFLLIFQSLASVGAFYSLIKTPAGLKSSSQGSKRHSQALHRLKWHIWISWIHSGKAPSSGAICSNYVIAYSLITLQENSG